MPVQTTVDMSIYTQSREYRFGNC